MVYKVKTFIAWFLSISKRQAQSFGPITTVQTPNNLDLIRLIAATEVLLSHANHHLNLNLPLVDVLKIIPGVPIFFFISGYLITASLRKIYYNDKGLYDFYKNRIIRLFPGLWVCFFASVVSVFIVGYMGESSPTVADLSKWAAAQLSFIQFYNPDFMRGYGVGVLNGSLWTIAVEMQFYVLTPFVLWAILQKNKWSVTFLLAIFVLANVIQFFNQKESVIEKFYMVSFIPWIYIFILGGIIANYKQIQDSLLRIPFILIVPLYLLTIYLSYEFQLGMGNRINFVCFSLLSIIILKLAYFKPFTASKILHRNDYSYGLYIYHMPVINLFLYMGYGAQIWYGFLSILTSFALAIISWHLIEKPALKLKNISLRKA